MGGPVPEPRQEESRPESGLSIAQRGPRGSAGPQRRQGRGGPRISSLRSRRERPPRRRRGSARRRTGEGRRRRGRREAEAPRVRNLRMRRTGGMQRSRARANGRRRMGKGRGMRRAAVPEAPRSLGSTAQSGSAADSVRREMARRTTGIQRGVAEVAYSRFPWSMAYPFHTPQEGHRAVHLMVEDPQEEHRKGMRYLRL